MSEYMGVEVKVYNLEQVQVFIVGYAYSYIDYGTLQDITGPLACNHWLHELLKKMFSVTPIPRRNILFHEDWEVFKDVLFFFLKLYQR